MGAFSIWHWVILLVIVLLLFGRGKIPMLMADVAKGIKAFKTGMKEDPETEAAKIDDGAVASSTKGSTDGTVKKDEAAEG
jgi:sec-independent protein translocase protein TatA